MTRSKPPEARRRNATASPTAPPDGRSYYGRPIVKPPVWDKDIAWYFFFGGLAGASATLAAGARRAGNEPLARAATLVAATGVSISPALLIRDLGRPERFLNMLRVFKPTSPMNLGSWILALEGTTAGLAALLELLQRGSRVQRLAETAAGALGPALATYTAVLVSDTAVPAWHEARRELPVVFAGSAAASAGAACMLLAPIASAGPARRLVVGGALIDEAAFALMERRLGRLAEPYGTGDGGRYSRRARRLMLAGAGLTAIAGRSKPGAAVAAGMTLAGAICRRFAIYKAGFDSALDPSYTVEPQRRRLDEAASPAD